MKQKKPTPKKTSKPLKKNMRVITRTVNAVDETALFDRIAVIIENRKTRIESSVNAELTLTYWEIGRFINSVILDGGRGEVRKANFGDTVAKIELVAYCRVVAAQNPRDAAVLRL